jgi:membrane protease YdiL (CAAX protease family)
MTFPSMILGPALAGIALTALLNRRMGLAELLSRMRRVRLAPRWFIIACLLAPGVLLVVLCAMAVVISPVFAPGLFPLGVVFGPIAGLFEEIGWSGFAYPRLQQRYGAIGGGTILGVIWGLWHLPVLDFMGAASPHGAYFPMFFAAFVAVVTPLRVLIGMLSQRTGSVAMAQLMHASLTGSLALLSPSSVSPAQEAAWYAVYAGTLWLVLAVVAVWRMRREQPLALRLRPLFS